MTPHPVASAPKELARYLLPPPVEAGSNFAQLLAAGAPPAPPSPSGASSGPSPAPASARPKTKNDGTDNEAATAAAAGAVPVPPAPVLQAITTTTSAGVTEVAAPAHAPTQAALAAAPAAAAQAAASLAADGASSGTSATPRAGAQTPVPPGAAELNARVVAAAPNLVSQPNSALAGLWHHTGADAATAPVSPQSNSADSGAGGTGSAPPAPPASPPAAPTASTPQTATFADALATPAHDAPGIAAATAAALPDPADTTTSATDTDPTGTGAMTAALSPADTASPQAAAPTPGPALPPPSIIPTAEQVALNLRQAVQNGTNRIEIQLKPAALGTIDVKLDLTHDGRLTAVISADRSDTLNLLRQDSSGLQQALRNAGLQADSGSLSFNLRGDAQSFAQNTPQAPVPLSTGTTTTAEPAAISAWQAHANATRRHDGALNIEV